MNHSIWIKTLKASKVMKLVMQTVKNDSIWQINEKGGLATVAGPLI